MEIKRKEGCVIVEFGENKSGEKLQATIACVSHDLKNKNSLMNLWLKNGWLERPLKSHWHIDTYVKDAEGNYSRKYNPQNCLYRQVSKKTGKIILSNIRIDFDWILEANDENLKKIIDEIERRFINEERMNTIVESI